jgi:transposase-like protein
MAKNQRKYTDDERASLIAILQAEGYPEKLGALKKVAAYAGVHENVLRRWWKGTQNPPPTTSVRHKKIDLSVAIREELSAIFTEMNTKRDEATYRDLGVVAGIMMDKQQLLENKPTERIAVEHSGQISIDERRNRINDLLRRDDSLRRFVGAPPPDD